MSSRIARLVFDALPVQTAEFGDACVAEVPSPASTAAPSLLAHLRHKLQSDDALAKLLQDGNADALTILFERHSALLFGIARRILVIERRNKSAPPPRFMRFSTAAEACCSGTSM